MAWEWRFGWSTCPWYVWWSLVHADMGIIFEWWLWRRRYSLYATRWCFQSVYCSPSSSNPWICAVLLSWGTSSKSLAWRRACDDWHEIYHPLWCPLQALRPELRSCDQLVQRIDEQIEQRRKFRSRLNKKTDTWDLKAFDLDISFRNYTWWLNWTCFFGSRDFGQQGFNGVGAKLSRPSSSPAVGMQHSGVPAAMDILQTCDLCKTWQNTLREWKLCCLQPWSCYGHNPVVLHFTFVLLGWNRGIWRCRDMLP